MRRSALFVAILAVGAALAGCDSEPRTVSGVLYDTRHVAEQTRAATRPHMVKRCHSATKRVRHTSGSGAAKRTWYTNEPTTVCTRVRQGTETYREVVRPERWCIELNDVNGKKTKDFLWYRVSRNMYNRTSGVKAGSHLTIEPDRDGC
jgi:hypothetical protein